jgi:Flp pilus assembly protein TadD
LTAGESAVGDVNATVALASTYIDARKHAHAERLLRQALTTSPDSAVLLANLARVQVLTDDYASAAHTAHSALAISPEYGFAMRMYAVALDGAGWLSQALWVAWRGATTHPNDPLAHFVYAELLMKAARTHEALYVVHEALRLEPANPNSHVLRGRILAKLGRVDESTASYEEALRLDPGHAAAVNNIAVNRLARSRWSTALRGFLGAARLDPELGDLARRNIGLALVWPLRLTTLGVMVLAGLVISGIPDPQQGSVTVGHRIIVGLCTLALLAGPVWLSRIVPLRTWRSVLRIRSPLVLRLALIVCALPVGVLATLGRGGAVTSVAAALLFFGGLAVALIGRFTGD